MIRLYGINNCGTCLQARRWLTSAGIDFEWHDFDRRGIRPETIAYWLNKAGLDTLLNKQSKAWRELDEPDRASVMASPAKWMAARVRLIKRPLLHTDPNVLSRFQQAKYSALLDHDSSHE